MSLNDKVSNVANDSPARNLPCHAWCLICRGIQDDFKRIPSFAENFDNDPCGPCPDCSPHPDCF